MVYVPFAAQQPKLFTRKREKEDAPLRLRLLRKITRQLDHAGCAGSVVIRARMDGSDLRRSQGMLVSEPQVIVMRSDDHVFGGLAGKVSCNIMNSFRVALDIHVDFHLQLTERERTGLQILV